MPVITRDRQTALILHEPTDRALRSLWDLAEMEFRARDGQEPVTLADWAMVTERYHALVTERRSELGAVIREVRDQTAPTQVHRSIQLRAWLTPFGEQLAAVLTNPVTVPVTWRVLTPADAVEVMRQLLRRLGLEDQQRVVYRDGRRGESWYENPGLFIHQWTNSESAIVVMDDAEGPLEMRFLMRVAPETVRTTYRLGKGPLVVGLGGALWDVGIRRIEAEVDKATTPAAWLEEIRARGFTVTERDTTLEIVYVMSEEPPRTTPERIAAYRAAHGKA